MNKAEEKTLLALLGEVPDYRKGNAIKYSLRDVLFLAIFAILCGAETYTGMHTFCELHIVELRKYLELPNGIPSHDVFGDIISRVDVKAVDQCFQIFTEQIRMRGMKDAVVALDGKTIRRSQSKKHRAFHIETAYLSDMEIVLGQVVVDEKSNEITAIPELLKMLALEGSTVTIDAIGTHSDIAEAVREAGAEYILPVKENQPTMLDDIQFYAENEVFTEKRAALEKEGRYAVQNNKGHGRIEKRECYLFDHVDWMKDQYSWKDLNDRYDQSEKSTDNSRNGYSSKTLKISFGDTEIAIPRDRKGEFNPQLLKKNQTSISEDIEAKIISMYAKGMTCNDINEHIKDIYGIEVSESTVSRITDRVLEEARDWQQRPLESIYRGY